MRSILIAMLIVVFVVDFGGSTAESIVLLCVEAWVLYQIGRGWTMFLLDERAHRT